MSPLSEFPSSRPARRISLTPLVDIVFILVVFFMLASSFERRSSIEVAMAGSGGAPGDIRAARLDVPPGGTFMFEGLVLDANELAAALGAFALQSPERPVVVALGDGAVLQDMVRALEIVEAANVQNVSVLPAKPGAQ